MVSWGSDTLRDILFGLVRFIIQSLYNVIDSVVLKAAGIDFIGVLSTQYKFVIEGFAQIAGAFLVLVVLYQIIIALTGRDAHEAYRRIILGTIVAASIIGSIGYLVPWFTNKFSPNGDLSIALSGVFENGNIFDDETLQGKKYGWQLCGYDSESQIADWTGSLELSRWLGCYRDINHIIKDTTGTTDNSYQTNSDLALNWLRNEHTYEIKGSAYNNMIAIRTILAANPTMDETTAKDMVIGVVNNVFNYNEKDSGFLWVAGNYKHQINEIPTFFIGIIMIAFLIVVALQILNRSIGLGWFYLLLPFVSPSLVTKEKKAFKSLLNQIILSMVMNFVQIFAIVFAFTFINIFMKGSGLFNLVVLLAALLFILTVPQIISQLIGAQSAGLMGGMYSMMMGANVARMGAATVFSGASSLFGMIKGGATAAGGLFNSLAKGGSGCHDSNPLASKRKNNGSNTPGGTGIMSGNRKNGGNESNSGNKGGSNSGGNGSNGNTGVNTNSTPSNHGHNSSGNKNRSNGENGSRSSKNPKDRMDGLRKRGK